VILVYGFVSACSAFASLHGLGSGAAAVVVCSPLLALFAMIATLAVSAGLALLS